MKNRYSPRSGVILGALLLAASPLGAQTQPAPTQPTATTTSTDDSKNVPSNDQVIQLNEFKVSGDRASLASAEEIKRNSSQIVDSIVADDITKLPDTNTAEALERVSGIQVGINTGEIGGNGGLAIRGLTQVENLIDGHEVFTAGGTSTGGVGAGTRTYDYSDLPTGLVGAINVYKTFQADQIEGGMGGTIDVHLHQPFDFAMGPTAAITVGTIYNSQYQEDKPNQNFLVSDTFNTGIGKFGILIDYSYEALPFREDTSGVGNPTQSPAGLINGSAAAAYSYPSGLTNDSAEGVHQHTGVDIALQWQVTPKLQVYLGSNYQDYRIKEDEYEASISGTTAPIIPGQTYPASTPIPGSAVTFPGSTAIESISFLNASGETFGIIRDVVHQERQYSGGFAWNDDSWSLKLDLNREDFSYGFYNNAVYQTFVAPVFNLSVSGEVPSASVQGASLLDPSIYHPYQVYNRLYPSTGYQSAGKLDFVYKLKDFFINSVKAGLRYSGTEDDNGTTGLYLGAYTIPTANSYTGNFPGQEMTNPNPNFMNGYSETSLAQYLTPLTTNLRNPASVLSAYGDTTTNITNDGTINPLSLYHLDEAVEDFYIMPTFAGNLGVPIDGNFGVRLARTQEDARGFQTSPTTAAIIPLASSYTYGNVLPAANVRFKIMDDLFVRVAYSKNLTRPQFSQLSPSLTLNQNPINPALNTGSAGNPQLHPFLSDNYDISIEKYFTKDSFVSLAGFDKSIDGYTVTVADTEYYGGNPYQISRPVNLTTATVKGGELAYQQFFDFLPAPLDGLGFQANFTYVASATPSSILTYTGSLPFLSRDSYNAILMYEKSFFSARLAYNWRSKFLNSVSTFAGIPGIFPLFTKQYGELDGSLNFAISKHVTLHVDAQNMTNTLRIQYFSNLHNPSSYNLDGVYYLASVTLKL